MKAVSGNHPDRKVLTPRAANHTNFYLNTPHHGMLPRASRARPTAAAAGADLDARTRMALRWTMLGDNGACATLLRSGRARRG